MKSREVNGGRANQLRFDDTPGEISAQLASDHGASQLNLGFLTGPTSSISRLTRGEGVELRSDLSVVLRGQAGVLISAEAAPKPSHFLYRNAFISVLENLQRKAVSLSKAAVLHAKDTADGPEITELVEKVNGLEKRAPEIVSVFGPQGTLVAGRIFWGAGTRGIDLMSGAYTRIAASGKMLLRSGKGVSLFSNEGGIKIISAAGKVQIQSQSDAIELLAKRVLEIISETDWVNIKAKKGVRLSGGNSELVVENGAISLSTSGKFEVRSSVDNFEGPRSIESDVERLFPEVHEMLNEPTWVEIALLRDGKPVDGERFCIIDPEGCRHEGKTDKNGVARIDAILAGKCIVNFPDILPERSE
jgi:type VI secretion system secreted protein VgrG